VRIAFDSRSEQPIDGHRGILIARQLSFILAECMKIRIATPGKSLSIMLWVFWAVRSTLGNESLSFRELRKPRSLNGCEQPSSSKQR
jgi:hypothetical protein